MEGTLNISSYHQKHSLIITYQDLLEGVVDSMKKENFDIAQDLFFVN
jgi:hypothetical protein